MLGKGGKKGRRNKKKVVMGRAVGYRENKKKEKRKWREGLVGCVGGLGFKEGR